MSGLARGCVLGTREAGDEREAALRRVRRVWQLCLGYSKVGAWDGLWLRSGHQGGWKREGGGDSAPWVTCQATLVLKRRKGGTLVACGCSVAPGG